MKNKEIIIKLGENIYQFCRANMYHKKNLPVTNAEMGMLIYIYTNKSTSVLSSEIASYFDVSKTSVTLIINKLINEGYVKKKIDALDKRKEPLYLTEKGITIINDHMEEYHQKTAQIVNMLGVDNARKFNDMLEKITQIIKE